MKHRLTQHEFDPQPVVVETPEEGELGMEKSAGQMKEQVGGLRVPW